MGLYAKTANAKAAAGGDYGKAGNYYVIIEMSKGGKHAVSGAEQAIFETKILHVINAAEWDSPNPMPAGMNPKGKGPKPMENCSYVFKDGVLGNEARLKAFLLKAIDSDDAGWEKEFSTPAKGEAAVAQCFDPVLQPLRNVVLEIQATPTKTRSQKDIVASKAQRRVYAEEIRALWEAGRLSSDVVDFLTKDERMKKMLEQEQREKAHKLQHAGK